MEGQELAARHIALREQAGLTQEQEAKMAGVSPTTISGIESGRIARPHLKTLLKIARALGADVGELRESGKGQAPPSPTQPPLNGFEEERRPSIAIEAILTAAQKWHIPASKPDATPEEISAAVDAVMGLCEALVEQVRKPSASWHDAERLEAVRTADHLLEIAEAGNNLILDSEQEDQANQRREHLRIVRDRISA